jgi:predicted O-methyltransferase YrrM
MSESNWAAVDAYIEERLVGADTVLDKAQRAAATGGLPAISVTAAQGKLLAMLVATAGARKVLEIGTLAGYSTIWLAREVTADGAVVTLEMDPRHAEVARRNFEAAGVSDKITVLVGAALDSLPRVEAEGRGPFDFVFIDADKINNAAYLDWAVQLTAPGSLIVVDNVIRDGAVIDADSDDPGIVGARAAFDLVAAHPRLDATAIQTVGSKGYDGFILARVL